MTFLDFGWIVVFAVIGAVGVGVGRHVFGYWFSPLGVFVGMNCGSIAAYHLRLLEFTDATFEAHGVLLAALGCYAVGTLLALEGVPRRELTSAPPACTGAGLQTFFVVTALLASVGWGLATLILIGRHGLGALLANIWVLQLEFQMQFIGYLNMIGILVLPTFVLKAVRQGWRWWELPLVAGALFGLLLAGIKAYLIYSLLITLFVWAGVRPDRFRPVHLTGGLLLMLVFFIAYTNKVDVFLVDRFESRSWLAHFPSLQRPYLYLVGSWPALENIVNGTAPASPPGGVVVLQPLWKVLGDGLGLIEPRPFNLPFTSIGTTFFNVYSMAGEVYWDFGWLGLVTVSTLLGFVATRLYVRMRTLGYWGHYLVYGTVAYGLFLSPFNYAYRFNVFVMLGYLFAVGFVAVRGGTILGRRRDG